MAKPLLQCLPGPLAKEAREQFGVGKNRDIVSNKDVMKFMKDKSLEVSLGAERAKKKAIAHAKVWSVIMDYQRRATKGEIKKGLATEDGLIHDPKAGLRAFLYADRHEMFGGAHLEGKIRAVQAEAHSRMNDMILDLNPNWFGFNRHQEALDTLVRSMYGDDTVAPKYKRWKSAWDKLNTELVYRYNNTVTEDAHLDVDKLPLPIQSNANKIKNFGTYAEWVEEVKVLLDLDKMGIDEGYSHQRLRKFYDDVVTEGAASRGIDQVHEAPFSKRFKEQRFLIFKDADSHLKYTKQFSEESPYASMMDHVTLISREIAMKEALGPSPSSTFRDLKNSLVIATNDKNAGDFAQKAFDNMSGALTPTSNRMSDSWQSARNVMTGTKLVGATLSAIGDLGFGAFTAHYNGLSASKNFGRAVGNIFKGPEGRRQSLKNAAKVGFLLEHAIDQLNVNSRLGDIYGRSKSARFAESTMRGSGLSAWTVAHKQAFHMEFMFELGTDGMKDKGMQRAFRRYGISAEDQKVLSSSPRIDIEGNSYLDPFALPFELKEKVVTMVSSETKYAVPEPDAAVQGFMNQGLRRGTIEGEVIRSAGQFKAFTVSIAMSHIARSMRGFEGSAASRIGYGAGLITFSTMLGALSLQAKEVAKGRKPRDMDNAKFWLGAAQQGGAMSIAGDLLLSDVDKYGQSMADYLGGPLGAEANKILFKGLIGNTQDVIAGEKTLEKVVREFGSGLVDYAPGQFWYYRLAYDRLLLDGARKFADPDWKRKDIQRELQRLREGDQNERWW